MKVAVFAEVYGRPLLVGTIDALPGIGEGFTYSESWLERQGAKPLSFSLPLREERFDARHTRPYFDGLIPEGTPRSALARKLHLSSRSYVKLLAALGDECIGAVSARCVDDADNLCLKPSIRDYERLEGGALASVLAELRQESAWLSDTTRFSLAGAQPKLSLYRNDQGEWFKPLGTAPSTHILKPTHARFKTAALNEVLCTWAAHDAGLPVPQIEPLDIGGLVVCTERFDRVIDDRSASVSGVVVPYRLHQEDMAQAMGIPPENKYEEGNQNHLADIATFLRTYSAEPIEDLRKTWRWAVFNFLIGNCDAHLKNIAVIRTSDWESATLAPFYDLVSTSAYDGLSLELAMAMGTKRKLADIGKKEFESQLEKMEMPKLLGMRDAEELAETVPYSLEKAAVKLSDAGFGDAEPLACRIVQQAKQRARALQA